MIVSELLIFGAGVLALIGAERFNTRSEAALFTLIVSAALMVVLHWAYLLVCVFTGNA